VVCRDSGAARPRRRGDRQDDFVGGSTSAHPRGSRTWPANLNISRKLSKKRKRRRVGMQSAALPPLLRSARNWLTMRSGSGFSGVAPSCEIPKKNEGLRSPAAPNCPGVSALGAEGRGFESLRPDHFFWVLCNGRATVGRVLEYHAATACTAGRGGLPDLLAEESIPLRTLLSSVRRNARPQRSEL
jgi:hypothetical protein